MINFPNMDPYLQPPNSQTNPPHPLATKKTEEKRMNQQNHRHTILTGPENQLFNFEEYTKPHQVKPKNFNFNIKETKSSLKSLKDLNWYEENSKTSQIAELNTYYNVLTEHLEQFTNFKKDLDKASTSNQQTNLQDEFNKMSNALKGCKTSTLASLEKSKIKLDKLKPKIEKDNSHFVSQRPLEDVITQPEDSTKVLHGSSYTVEKVLPDYPLKQAIAPSSNKAQLGKKNYDDLEAALKRTQLRLNDVVNLEEYLKLTLEAVPVILKEKQKTLSWLALTLNTTELILSQLDIEAFSKDFKETADKRDLAHFYKTLEDCQKHANIIPNFRPLLDTISDEFLAHNPVEENKSVVDFSTTIKNAVKNISLRIDALNMSKSDNLGDLVFEKKLEAQKSAAITNLETLQNDITSKYNTYRLELNDANYRSLIFNRLVNLKAKLVRLYLDTETIRSTMRDMRKRENTTRQEHQSVYDTSKSKFSKIVNEIFQNKTASLFYPSISNKTLASADLSSQMIVVDSPLADTLSKQIAQLYIDDNVYFNCQATINSLIADNQIDDQLAKQLQNLKNHLQAEKNKTITAYSVTLKNMCIRVKEEINLMGKALTYIPDTYDKDFRSAYTYKNYIAKQLQEKLGSYGEYKEYTFPSEKDFL